MQVHKTDSQYVITIDQGEEVVSSLTAWAKNNGIQNAHFTGIGAVRDLECGYYELSEKKYHFTEYSEMLEVVSLTGNIMLKDGAPFVHVHGVFTDTTNNAFGGHINRMTVGVTLEIMLTPLSSTLDRQLNDNIGLFLLNCPQ